MPVRFDRLTAPPVIRLEGEMDIAGAGELKTVLLDALRSRGEVCLSLERATGIDVTVAQLLWAAQRAARDSGVVLAIAGPVPEAMRRTFREAGFETFPFTDEAEPESEG